MRPDRYVASADDPAAAIGRSRARTNEAVNTLLEHGILIKGTIGRRNRVFEVSGLLDAITGLERRLAASTRRDLRHTPESDVAHPRVDGLGSTGCRSIPTAV